MDDSSHTTTGRCPLCKQDTDKVATPFYDNEKLTLYFRGKSVKLTPTLGALWEIMMLNWPKRSSNSDLFRVWGLLDVNTHNNLNVNMHKLRKRVAALEITIKNVDSRSRDHLDGGFWPDWGVPRPDVFPYDFGERPDTRPETRGGRITPRQIA